jgi:uncharacterized membrane protein YsdA (DUF1294 family)
MGTVGPTRKPAVHEGRGARLVFAPNPRDNRGMSRDRRRRTPARSEPRNAKAAAPIARGRPRTAAPPASPSPGRGPRQALRLAPRPVFRSRRRFVSPNLIFGAVAAALVGMTLLFARQQRFAWVPAYVVGVNAATFLLYAYDKAVAGRGRLRVPEAVLHALAIVGGTFGGLIGQRLFRHKISKASFQRVFVATALLQVGGIATWIWWSRRS